MRHLLIHKQSNIKSQSWIRNYFRQLTAIRSGQFLLYVVLNNPLFITNHQPLLNWADFLSTQQRFADRASFSIQHYFNGAKCSFFVKISALGKSKSTYFTIGLRDFVNILTIGHPVLVLHWHQNYPNELTQPNCALLAVIVSKP